MKNLFTFIVALFMATSMYAQGTYAVANGETFTPGYKISKVPNITAYYMANDGNVFNAGKKTANWADSDFENYVSITKTGAPAQFDGKNEPTGAYLKFEPTNDGTIIVGIQIDKFKELCLVGADFARVTDYTYNLPSDEGLESQTLGTNKKTDGKTTVNNCLTIKSNGTVTFNVKAGYTYYLMALGSKIGFFGFKYSVNEKVTITDAGFATHASKFAVDYSNRTDGLEAYAVKYANGRLTYNKIHGIVPANTAVLLKGDAKEYTLTAAKGEATTVDTDLKVADGKTTGDGNIYCLAKKKNGVGFYQVANTVTIPANKAYLEIGTPVTTPAKYYSIGIGGNTTGIQAIQQNGVKADGIMYSLSGQKVGANYKGIVICNGKKMIKK